MATMATQELLTLDEASVRFNVPISTLRFWRDRGTLTRWKRGRLVVVDADEVKREVEKRNQPRREGQGGQDS